MIRSKAKVLFWLGLLQALLPVAGAAAAETQPRTVTVIASEYQFMPKSLTFQRGMAYRLHVENRGKETHEFTAPEFFKAVQLRNPAALNADKTEIVVQPGEAKDLDFVPHRAGRYKLRCADHDWAGMVGGIVVK
jgi:uncharacterized cupredoxin-like copper-binding protein